MSRRWIVAAVVIAVIALCWWRWRAERHSRASSAVPAACAARSGIHPVYTDNYAYCLYPRGDTSLPDSVYKYSAAGASIGACGEACTSTPMCVGFTASSHRGCALIVGAGLSQEILLNSIVEGNPDENQLVLGLLAGSDSVAA